MTTYHDNCLCCLKANEKIKRLGYKCTMKKLYLSNRNGFTLIELMVTIAVAGILLGIAVPSFVNMVRDNQDIANTNQLSGVFRWARTEAIKQGNTLSLCSSTNQTTCRGSSKTNWADGWIIFIDQDGDGVFDSDGDAILCEAGEDCLLRSNGSVSNATLVANQSNPLSFSSKGLPEPEPSPAYRLTYTPDNCPSGDKRLSIVEISSIGKTIKKEGDCL